MNFNIKNMFRKLRRIINVLLGRDLFLAVDVKYENIRLGSEYGGWNIIPGYISKDSIVHSFGVGEDISFDIGLIEKYGVTVHAFDPTPRSIQWVKNQNLTSQFVMHEYGILDYDGFVNFHPPKDINHISHTIIETSQKDEACVRVPVKKIQTILKELQHNSIDLLKMDIEGAEYSVIKDMQSTDIRPKQLLVEFHHRFKNIGAKETKDAVEIIRKWGGTSYFLFQNLERSLVLFWKGLINAKLCI